MNLSENDIRILVRQILEQEEKKTKKTKKKIDIPLGISNAFKKIDVLKLGEKLAKKNSDEAKAAAAELEDVPSDKQLPGKSSGRSVDGTKRDVIFLNQLAMQLDKNKDYNMIADNKQVGLKEFMGILHGMKSLEPETFDQFMQKKFIKKVFEEYESKFPFKAKIRSQDDQAVSKGGSKKKSGSKASSTQVKDIQKIVGTDVDGKWGKNTTAKWKEWISSEEGMQGYAALVAAKGKDFKLQEGRTLKRLEIRNLLETTAFFPYLNEEENLQSDTETMDTEVDQASPDAPEKPTKPIPGNVKKFIDDNKGNAAKLAKALGYTANLAGVHQLAKDIKEKSKGSTKTEKFTDSEGVTYTRKDEGDGAVSYDPGDGGNPITISSDEAEFKRLEDEYKTQESDADDTGSGSSDTGLFLDKVNEIKPKAVWLKCIPVDSENLELNKNENFPFVVGYSKITEKDVDDLNSDFNKYMNALPRSPSKNGLPGVLGDYAINIITLSIPPSMERLFIDGPGPKNYVLDAKYSKKTIGGKDYYVLGDSEKDSVPESYKEAKVQKESLRLMNILKKHKLL